MSTVIENKTEAFRARLAELNTMQSRIPYELAAAEEALTQARDAHRFARQNVVRTRALAEIGEAAPGDLKAAEHAARLATESEREAEDRLAAIVEKLPALAAAIADTTDAYRSGRLPSLLASAKDVAERMERAWTALLAACAEGNALHEEIERDYLDFTTVHAFQRFDNRIPHALPALLGYGKFNDIPKLAERWRELREKI